LNRVILDLLSLTGVGRGSIRKMLGITDIDSYSSENIDELINLANKLHLNITVPTKQELCSAKERTKRILDICFKNNIDILTPDNSKYPVRFLSIKDYPVILFAKGNLKTLNAERNVAIIGTRKPSDQGSLFAEKLGKWFAKNGYVITSGLALGCDSAAHRGCLAVEGVTVAILANSLDTVSPKANKELAEQIVMANGCLLSEYAPTEKTLRSNFIARDRLQSALAQGVIVIETAVDGGSMHAVKAGITYGRHIACIDFGINAIAHQDGNMQLIHQGKAMAISNNADIKRYVDLLSETSIESSSKYIVASKHSSNTQISIFDL